MISHISSATSAPVRRVAVLDDDVRYIRMVERMLNQENVEVLPITTMDVDEAIGVITSTKCDAAIIDVYMYGSQLGFGLVERLRAHPATANLPIIVASGARREIGKKVSFLQQHRCGVLVKPFETDDLIDKLEGVQPEATDPSAGTAASATPFSNPLRRVTAALLGATNDNCDA